MANGFMAWSILKVLGLLVPHFTKKNSLQECAKTKFSKEFGGKKGAGVNPAKITTTVGLNIGKIDTEGIR